MCAKMTSKRSALSKSLLAAMALVRFFPSVSSSVLYKIPPGGERSSAELANFWFFSSVNPHVNFHVVPANKLPAVLTRKLTLAGVGPHVFLEAVAVESFKPADSAGVFFSGVRLLVNPHVSFEVGLAFEGFLADLADKGLVIGVLGHMCLQISF